MFGFAGRDLRMIVRRQPTRSGDQLSFDDVGGWRFHAIVTNIAPLLATAADVEHHHRLRGGAPEEAIRQLKEDSGLCHAPLENFFGNWVWWHASALAYNVARWLRVLALPPSFRTCRGKRLRLSFFNVAPASCTPVAGWPYASLVPMPTPVPSSRPSPGCAAFPSSPDDPGRRTPSGATGAAGNRSSLQGVTHATLVRRRPAAAPLRVLLSSIVQRRHCPGSSAEI